MEKVLFLALLLMSSASYAAADASEYISNMLKQYAKLSEYEDEGTSINIDAEKNIIEVKLSDEELIERRKTWQAPALKKQSGSLYKYAKLVSTASEGCVTDE